MEIAFLLLICYIALFIMLDFGFHKYDQYRRIQYANNHFKLTERYRNGIS